MPSGLYPDHDGQPRPGRVGQGSEQAPAPSLHQVTPPSLSLPKGGGAIRGIAEAFSASRVTGTGSMSVPIGASPGRAGFGPGLALTYDSGAGNGPFGFGWSPDLTAVTRKTDRGLPQYRDAAQSDVFMLSGLDDLVPTRDLDGVPVLDSTSVAGFSIARYRPRIEGGFARIERWSRAADGDVHWRVLSSDNVLFVYGRDAASRIADPANPTRIFSWLLCETRDDRGNAVLYEYKAEDSTGVDVSAPHERCRGDAGDVSRTANRYLKRVRYGNRVPFLDEEGRRPVDLTAEGVEGARWMFEIVFDYGEHDPEEPTPKDAGPWLCRNDPFSSYRPTFEVRTYRLCQRILMFHHFPDEEGVGADCLVRSTELAYRELRGEPEDRKRGHPLGSFLASIVQTGHMRSDGGGYTSQSLPPVELEYSRAAISGDVRELDAGSLENLPAGIDGRAYRWVDLDGEGLSGILSEVPGAWYYKRNLGGGRFGPALPVAPRPSFGNLLESRQALMDLSGDGQIDLVQLDRPPAGYYERDGTSAWANFVPFTELPNVNWDADDWRLIDLTGDGLADLLLTEDEVFTWYPSLSEAGFGPAVRQAQAAGEEHGARLVFADGTDSIFLADMSGDGLTDLVRIRNGEISYWPNLGYCRFGARVVMRGAPLFDTPERFDPRRIRLADIDGSGVADLLYLGDGEVRVWLNEAGNGWSAPNWLPDLPHVDNFSDIEVVDLFGSGTACLVWSSRLPADAGRPVLYVDLMGGTKPNLLVKSVNNLGGETRIHYAPSTRFYLADRQAGRPWITRLPFPVQVVEKVESFDHVSRTRFASRFAYHHGFFDGVEREFRGFGMVEQHDSEAFEDYVVGTDPDGPQELAPEFYQPPVTTRAWFHTGAFGEGDLRLHPWAPEYYEGEQLLPDPVLPGGMNDEEMRDCLRALKGALLREEVYSFDGSSEEAHPYSVAEHAYEVRRLQRPSASQPAVFHPCATESIAFHYERNPADPRVAHSFNLEIGPCGDVVRSAAVAYGRKISDPDLPAEVIREQQRLRITYGEIDSTPDIDRLSPSPAYRLRRAFETRSYEITGLEPAGERFGLAEIEGKIAAASPIEYHEEASGLVPQKRRLSHGRVLFRDDALTPLPLGEWDSRGIPYEGYRLAFTPAVVALHYAGEVSDADFGAAGFVHFDGDANWWIPSGIITYPADPAAHFYLPNGTRDALGAETLITPDKYDLLSERVTTPQAAWNEVRAVNDYRVLGPVMMVDPNQNRSAVAFDALGMVTRSAIMGKEGGGEGDTLDDPTTLLDYDLFRWMTTRQPVHAHLLAREEHGPANSRWQESYVYSNGGGGVAMVKTLVNPGKALKAEDDGTLTEVDADPRWIGNGRTIVNNKGAPVKQYEPYFSTTHDYEDERALREIGATPITHYDPLGRSIRTDLPNGTLARIEFGPWFERVWDPNDTILESRWYTERGSPDPLTDPEPLGDPEARAAWLAARHSSTPGIAHSDSLGRSVYAVADLGAGRTTAVRTELDLTGRSSKLFDPAGRMVSSGFTGEAGTPIFAESAEKGKRWTFLDVLGGLVRTWDEQGRSFRTDYDALHRPTATFAALPGQGEILFNYVVYGDQHPQAADHNLLGSSHQVFDPSGMVRVQELDFKGNPLSVERVFARDYKKVPDWGELTGQLDYAAIQAAAAPDLDLAEPFEASSTYDALSRPARVTLADGTVIALTYNPSGFLDRLQAQAGGQGAFLDFLKSQDYDALGRRRFAHYGNDVLTSYFYDPQSFRLTNLLTVKSGDPRAASLQDLHFATDPVGNVTEVWDDAQQTHYFDNAVVEPRSLFSYDAIYQLVRAVGREHAGIAAGEPKGQDIAPRNLPHANDASAVRTYIENYAYDDLGNILSVQRVANGGSWTRRYGYAYQDDPADRTNRLTATSVPGDPDAGPFTTTYDHDAFGNMTRMRSATPDELSWNFLDQLQRADLGGGGAAFYVHRLGGGRLRKVIERPGGKRVERLYLGALEIYRERDGDVAPNFERHTLHISDEGGCIAQVDIKTIDDDGQDPANPLGTPLVRYQHGNHLGSAALETDASGTPISYEEFHPYGTTAYRSSRPGVDLSLKRYRFSGKERDEETGLYYFGARYYAPWLGRWTSADPAGFLAGLNLYRYCSNNPSTRTDPYGLDDEDRCWVMHPTMNVPTEMMGTECHIPGMQYVNEKGEPITKPPDGATADSAGGPGAPSPTSTAPANAGTPPPVRAGITAIQEGARPTAAMVHDPSTRASVGQPRTFPPGGKLQGPYNLWSNPKGGGLESAAKAPGFIMGDTAFEELAEQRAIARGYTGRNDPRLTRGNPHFDEVWHPTSDALAKRAGLSQMGVESHGLDPASLAKNPGYNPKQSVQVGREIPRVQKWGGAMAGLGILSGVLAIWQGSDIPNPGVKATAYVTGVGEILGSLRYLQGLWMLSRFAPGSAGVMAQGAMAGRIFGGVGAIVLSSYSLYNHLQEGNYGVTLGDTAGIVGGFAILAGSGPVAAIAGGVAASNYLGDYVERKVTAATGSRAAGVVAGTAAGAATGAVVGAAVGFFFFGVGAPIGAAVGAVIGGIAGFIGSFW